MAKVAQSNKPTCSEKMNQAKMEAKTGSRRSVTATTLEEILLRL
jgi:hypothetical protein